MTKITTSPLSAQSHGAVLKEDNKGHKAIAAASIGNALEWYDFSVYAFFAVYIAQNFFHQTDAGAQLFEAFLASD